MTIRKRVGVLISGRGSNLASLIEAQRAPDYPAEIVLVLSNKADALGLVRAKEAGIATRRAFAWLARPSISSAKRWMQARSSPKGRCLFWPATMRRRFPPAFSLWSTGFTRWH